jgi:hypothetical protein
MGGGRRVKAAPSLFSSGGFAGPVRQVTVLNQSRV